MKKLTYYVLATFIVFVAHIIIFLAAGWANLSFIPYYEVLFVDINGNSQFYRIFVLLFTVYFIWAIQLKLSEIL